MERAVSVVATTATPTAVIRQATTWERFPTLWGELLDEVWGPSHERDTNYLRVFMAQVRRKLEPDTAAPRFLQTVWGAGYRFTETPS